MCPRDHQIKVTIPCNPEIIFKMNYTTALVFAIALLAQLVSCSKVVYKVVCETEYSYVLKHFNSTASDFQAKLCAVNACLDRLEMDRMGCLEATRIASSYHWNVLNLDSGVFSLTANNINELHQKACKALNEQAEEQKYAKDIELKEYDIFADSEGIKTLLETLQIGIKVESKQSKTLKETTELLKKYFKDIKKTLSFEADEVDENVLDVIEDKLSSVLEPLSGLVVDVGGLYEIDDIDLVILLNKCLNLYAEKYLPDSNLNLNENEESDSEDNLDSKLKVKGKKWFWVKVGAGIFAVAVLAGLVILYLRSSAVHEDKDAYVEA